MRFVFAPDSFKGSLSAARAAELLAEAASAHFSGVQCLCVPIADGGEGTLEALLSARGGELRKKTVSGPLGAPVEAGYAAMGDGEAVVEMARASGLPLVAEAERDVMRASTRGTGELILAALDGGARRLLIGIGGSATNDLGTGMLRALGARFPDKYGIETADGGGALAEIAAIDLRGLDPRLREAEITVMCDVSNPLLGKTGATYVYGPQKGAGPAELAALEGGMASFAALARASLGLDIASFPGAGAAGGMGAALGGLLGARLSPGIEAVMEFSRLGEKLEGAALCVTGEGRVDGQSVRFGKVVSGLAKACAARGVPLCVLAGAMDGDARALFETCEASIMTTVRSITTLDQAMRDAEELFRDAADRMFRLLKIGFLLK